MPTGSPRQGRDEHSGDTIHFGLTARNFQTNIIDSVEIHSMALIVLRPGNVVAGASRGAVVQGANAIQSLAGEISRGQTWIDRDLEISASIRRHQRIDGRRQ